MLVLNFFKLWKITSSIRQRNYCSTKKQSIFSQNNVKLKIKPKLNNNELVTYETCIKHGLSPNTILTNKWILNMTNDNLCHGLSLLNCWNPKKIDDLVILLQISLKKLEYYTPKIISESSIVVPYTNRVYYFAENFEKSPDEVCRHLIQYRFLLTKNFLHIHELYQLFIENNINKNSLWKDVWVFSYSKEFIIQRISHTKLVNVAIKPWMLRCQKDVFERSIKIKQENMVVLNKYTTAQYLAKRLKVSEKDICHMCLKYPLTLRVNPTKLKEILDFLLKVGFETTEILSIPRVFTHSISTLQERLTELRNLGCEPSITQLCKNQKSYEELINKLILKNIEKLNNFLSK